MLERNVFPMKSSHTFNKSLFHKPVVKQCILTILPLVIGAVCSAMGTWNPKDDNFFWFKLLFLVFSLFLEVLALHKYYKWETEKDTQIHNLESTIAKLNLENQRLSRERSNFRNELIDISTISRDTSHDLNKIAHQITENGTIDLGVWNYSKSCHNICTCAYNMIQKISLKNAGFAVSYIQKEEENGKSFLEMSANEGTPDDPEIKGARQPIENLSNYYYAQLFLSRNASVVALPTPEEISKRFYFPKSDGNKYSQYIAVPVMCSNHKMIGLLQIAALKNSIIAETEQELIAIANDYLAPLATLAMLMNKIEKTATAIPRQGGQINDQNIPSKRSSGYSIFRKNNRRK